MKFRLKYLAPLGALAMALSMTACSSSSSTPTASGSDTSSASNASSASYALILKALDSDFWKNMKAGAIAEAQKQGVTLDVYAGQSETDTAGQVTLLQNAITKKYTAIGVAPISPTNMNAAVAQATKAGIYIVNVDEQFDTQSLQTLGGAAQAFTTTDNVAAAKMAGDYLVQTLGAGSDQVAIVAGQAGDTSSAERVQGVTESFTAAGYNIVAQQPGNWDATTAYNLAQSYISKYPDLKAIYACNDVMAMGVLKAVQASGKDIAVVGNDGDSDAIASVASGTGLLATIKQDSATEGAKVVDLMIQYATQKPAIDPTVIPDPTYIPAILVTKDNASTQ